MAAGIATLKVLGREKPYERLRLSVARVMDAIMDAARDSGLPVAVNQIGSMAGFFFCEGPVETFHDVMRSDAGRYAKFFHAMLDAGVYLAPSPYEALFVSTAHTEEVLCEVAESVRESMPKAAAPA